MPEALGVENQLVTQESGMYCRPCIPEEIGIVTAAAAAAAEPCEREEGPFLRRGCKTTCPTLHQHYTKGYCITKLRRDLLI